MEKNVQTSRSSVLWVLVALAVLVIGTVVYTSYIKPQPPIGGQTDEHGCLIAAGYSWCEARQECERSWERYCTVAEPKVAIFTCDEGKVVTATFYPTDDQYVDLVLSDGSTRSVPRAISASGARYANADESFVFWNKGDTAFVTENGTTTYAGCVIEAQ